MYSIDVASHCLKFQSTYPKMANDSSFDYEIDIFPQMSMNE